MGDNTTGWSLGRYLRCKESLGRYLRWSFLGFCSRNFTSLSHLHDRKHANQKYLLRASPPSSRYCTRSVTFLGPPSTVFRAALQMRCKNIDILLLGTPGIFGGWTLQGYSAVGHCRDTWHLGTAGLQGYSLVGHCGDTWWLGTAGILCGSALQGYLVVGH